MPEQTATAEKEGAREDVVFFSRPREPYRQGPARRITEWPLLLVLGTQSGGGNSSSRDSEGNGGSSGGETATTSTQLRELAVYLANLFVLTSDASVPIVTDAELTDKKAARHNLIVIGGPKHNLWARRLAGTNESAPVRFHGWSAYNMHPAGGTDSSVDEAIEVGTCSAEATDSGACGGSASMYLDGTPDEGRTDAVGEDSAGRQGQRESISIGRCHFDHPHTGLMYLTSHSEVSGCTLGYGAWCCVVRIGEQSLELLAGTLQ